MGTNAGGTTGLGNVMDLGVERRAWWGFCKRRQEKVFVMEAVRTCVREIAAATISGSLSLGLSRVASFGNVTRRYAFASRSYALCPPHLETNETN